MTTCPSRIKTREFEKIMLDIDPQPIEEDRPVFYCAYNQKRCMYNDKMACSIYWRYIYNGKLMEAKEEWNLFLNFYVEHQYL